MSSYEIVGERNCLNCTHWRTMHRNKETGQIELTYWGKQRYGECKVLIAGHYKPPKHVCSDFSCAEKHIVERRLAEFLAYEENEAEALGNFVRIPIPVNLSLLED